MIRAVQEAISLITVDHIGELLGEDIVAAILDFVLACHRVSILDWKILLELFLTELALSSFASLEIHNGSNINILLTVSNLHVVCLLGSPLPALGCLPSVG